MSTRHSFLSTTGLLRANSSASTLSTRQTNLGNTKVGSHIRVDNTPKTRKTVTRAGVVPLGPTFIIFIAFFFSFIFIFSISFAFVGSEDEETFKDLLNDIAHNSPGIVLVGDNVDVDVDEPSITIRWTILGCGQEYMLSGAEGSHGSDLCGVPSMPLNIFVDSSEDPTAVYDPASVPYANETGQRRSIQSLHQFDSDHALDVHRARLYPFDTYQLTSNIRILSTTTDKTLPITKLPISTHTDSFLVKSTDSPCYIGQTDNLSRILSLTIQRPGEAKAFALLLFAVNWVLAHASIAYTFLILKVKGSDKVLKYLAFVAASLLLIPQLRDAMPDAPGFDGVLIDGIGFFPQMLVTGVSIIIILAHVARKELQLFALEDQAIDQPKEAPAPLSHGLRRLRLAGSKSSVDLRHLRAFSRNFTQVEPPSPIMEQPA